jgi:preprotein translocase subunit YajC
MYMLLVRPQQRRVREQRALVRQVGIGAEVQTIGGMVGRVVGADDEFVRIEISPGVVVTFVRAAVGRILDVHAGDGPDEDDRPPEDDGELRTEHPGESPGADEGDTP